MPRKEQGWITFQSSESERKILEQICQQTQRTKTEILREMIRQMGQSLPPDSGDADEIEFSEDMEEDSEDIAQPMQTTGLQSVQISARNILRAKVKQIVKGSVNVEVTLEIAPGVELVSIVTRTSADKLKLRKGKAVFAVVKSSSVMIAAG